ncbi:MAG: DUF456 domain-containing protein [Halothermotrichaceae bacterium]
MSIFLWIIISLLFIFSLIGVVIPVIPDTILLWVGFLIYEFFMSGTALPVLFWAGMLVLTILILASDFFANAYFVKKYGGSKLAVIAALIGLLTGTIFLGPAGIFIGPFVLVFITALLEKKEGSQALKIGIATSIGIFSSTVAKIVLQTAMIIWFIIVVI